MERIVVGVDGSDDGRRALQWAVREGGLRGALVEAIHVWHEPYMGANPMLTPAYPDPEPFERAARSTLEREIASVDQSGLPQLVEPVVLRGTPAAALIDRANGADLVVVGTRGLGGFTGLLLGSVSHQLTHHAPCAVVIVRGETGR
ncbi:MAG: universal stress protein [Acidimicrobiales bacterium]